MKNTKFVACMVSIVGLLGTAIAGKFTGELGMWVATVCCAYCGANEVITRAALITGQGAPAQ